MRLTTFETHGFVFGGGSKYHMAGPDGESSPGWWTYAASGEPRRLEFTDGFSDEAGELDTSMPAIRSC